MVKRLALFISALALDVPAIAGAGNFVLVNNAGGALSEMAIRRTGTSAWTALPNSAPNGGSTAVKFSDEDCAFDIRAKLGGTVEVTWSGLNLCEVSRVTLRRSASGTAFASYD